MTTETEKLKAAFDTENFKADALAKALQSMAYADQSIGGVDREHMAFVSALHTAALHSTARAFIAYLACEREPIK